jgi:hypothetical protein
MQPLHCIDLQLGGNKEKKREMDQAEQFSARRTGHQATKNEQLGSVMNTFHRFVTLMPFYTEHRREAEVLNQMDSTSHA